MQSEDKTTIDPSQFEPGTEAWMEATMDSQNQTTGQLRRGAGEGRTAHAWADVIEATWDRAYERGKTESAAEVERLRAIEEAADTVWCDWAAGVNDGAAMERLRVALGREASPI